MERNEIKMLFMAYYAPMDGDFSIPKGIKDISYAKYHHRVFEVLQNLFPKIESSNSPGIMLDKGLSSSYDYIFSLFNRIPFRNSEVFVSALAEYHSIPYLGATPNIRALAEDKHLAKMMAKHAGVATPEWSVYIIGGEIKQPNFSPPYFIKPRFGAASTGIDENSSCFSWAEAKERILYLHKQNLDAIVEKQILGVYHTSPVIDNFGNPLFLPCISQHSILRGGIVTYEQKRSIVGGLERRIVANMDLTNKIQNASRKMLDLVQPIDYTRFDFIVEEGTLIPYFLEFNVCCNLGEHSTLSQAAKNIGIGYEELIENITYSSLFRQKVIDVTYGKEL